MFMITVLACSLVAGAVDDTSERVDTALWIFGMGLLVLVIHATVFTYRSLKKQRKSGWAFWSVLVLSVFIIPIVFFMVAMSAGMSCGFGASNGPTFLLIFEFVGLAIQLASWRFSNQPVQSPIPLD
jgi:hypothetical protein